MMMVQFFFNPFEVVDRGSETQLQMGEKINLAVGNCDVIVMCIMHHLS